MEENEMPRYKFGSYHIDEDNDETPEYYWFIIDTYSDKIIEKLKDVSLSDVRLRCQRWNKNFKSEEELTKLFEKEFGKIPSDGKFSSFLNLTGYKHPLPNSIKNVSGHIWVDNDYTGLPDNFNEWNIGGKIIYYI